MKTILEKTTISSKTEFVFPINDQRIKFEDSGIKDVIQGSGDSKALMLILSAELQISSVIGPIQRNDSSAGDLNLDLSCLSWAMGCSNLPRIFTTKDVLA